MTTLIHPTRAEVQTPEQIYHERNLLLTTLKKTERRVVALRTINRMLHKRLKKAGVPVSGPLGD